MTDEHSHDGRRAEDMQTVAEMHADLDAAERLEMLQLLLKDYVGDASGRRILGKIIKEMSQEQDGS